MTPLRILLRRLLPSLLLVTLSAAGGELAVHIKASARQSGADEVKWRLRAAETPPTYDVAKESFRVIVPDGLSPQAPPGILIWISAGNEPTVPKDWFPVLQRRRLVFAGARHSGNRRNIFDRIRLAVDLNHHLRTTLKPDLSRVYVSGFSGGGRVASMVGVGYADMFTGTICWMGANFYRPVQGPSGNWYRQGYLPDDDVLRIAKQRCGYVLVTGDKDFNLDNTLGVFDTGFQHERFQRARLLRIPDQGHRLPPGEWLERALDLLEKTEP